MHRLAVFAALRWECRPVLRHLRRPERRRVAGVTLWRGIADVGEIWVVQTGMGARRARHAAEVMRSLTRCDAWLSTGCAGALCADLAAGDLVVGTRVLCGDGTAIDPDPQLHASLVAAAARAGTRAVCAPMLCSDAVIASPAAKAAAAQASGAAAVEMEGAAVAAAAAGHGIAFAAVRSILDGADATLSTAGQFVDPDSGAVRPLDLARYVVRERGAVGQLRALQRMMRAAESSLERLFEALLTGAISIGRLEAR